MLNNVTRRRAPALTVRLIAGYTAAAALILTISALFLYRGLQAGFIVEDTELLSDQVEQVRGAIIKGEAGVPEAKRFILGAAGVRNLEKYYGRLLDENGVVLVETPGMDHVAPAAPEFPKPTATGKEATEPAFWQGPTEPLALLISAEVARPDGLPSWVFQIALDAEHVAGWLADYRKRLYLMVSAGSLGTALLGWFITRRGLRPLRQITETVKDVSTHEYRGELDAQSWPSELADLAEEFDGMLSRLRSSFDRLAQFSADVSHEFRTPLNNLMGATTLALSRPRTVEEYRAALEGNLEQFERLGRMVESLLFIARAGNAEAVLTKHPCDAATIIPEVCDFFSALAEERGISLGCAASGTVLADELLLRLSLTNLVSNAIRHTPNGGRVDVTAEAIEGGGHFEISVRDTGVGIPEEHHSRLFDRFYRVDSSRAGSQGGSGLGLAIVKTVMTLHGGSIGVASEPGNGTTFWLRFPISA